MSPTTTRRRITVAAVIVVLSIAAAILTTTGRGDAAPEGVVMNTTTTTEATTTTETVVPDVQGDQVDLDRLVERATIPVSAPDEETETEDDEPGGDPSVDPAATGGGGGTPGPTAPSGSVATPESIAAAYGLQVIYDPHACSFRPRPGRVGGCVKSAQPDRIYLTARTPLDQAITVTHHEIAHIEIARRCGPWDLPMVGARMENVTDAYAVSYIGPMGHFYYGYTASDTALARRIHAGDCGPLPPEMAPAPPPRLEPVTTTTTAPPPPPLPAPGHVTATVRATPGRKVDVYSPQPVERVGACIGATATGGWTASCAGGRVAVTTPTAGVEPGDSTTVRVSTARGWTYTVTITTV